MDTDLRTLLSKVASNLIGAQNTHTHVTLHDPHARWNIPDINKSYFWNTYCDIVQRNIDNDYVSVCLAERQQESMPLISKLTLKYPTGISDISEYYNGKFLQEMCYTYQKVISEYFEITDNNNYEYAVVVLESSLHWIEEDTSTGDRFKMMQILFQFPFAVTDVGHQSRMIRPRVIQLLRNNDVLSKMNHRPIGDWEQIISSNVMNEPQIMYGSSEKSNIPKLVLSHVWPLITKDILDSLNDPVEVELSDAFDLRIHSDIQTGAVDQGIFNTNTNLEFWLPMFLSVKYWTRALVLKQSSNDNGRFTKQLQMVSVQPKASPSSSVSTGEVVDPYIGKHNDMCFPLIDKSLSGYHNDVAKVLLFTYFKTPDTIDVEKEYSLIYDESCQEYYQWNYGNKLWERYDKTHDRSNPRQTACDDLILKYEEIRRTLFKQIDESQDDVFKSNADIQIKRITSLIGKLKTVSFKACLWTECREIISRNFLPKRDKVSTELPLNDGTLYNIFTRASRIRTVNDYYTFTLQGHINPNITTIKPYIPVDLNKTQYNPHQMMWRFFHELMSENEEMTIFLITTIAIYISGDTKDFSFMCGFGESQNGKSALILLLEWFLGEYIVPASDGLFIDSGAKPSANAHTSQYDAISRARIVYLDETKQGAMISTDTIKKISGGVTLANRAPYSKTTINFKPLCHSIIFTQHLPAMDTSDQGMLRRMRIVPFRSWFRPENPTQRNNNPLKIYNEDKDFINKLMTSECGDALMSMLALAADQYFKNGYK